MRKRTFLSAAVLSVLVLGLASSGLEAAEARVHFVGLLHAGGEEGGTEFSAGSLRDLLIIVQYLHLTGTHSQRLELYSPDGALYQRLATGFTVADRVPVAAGLSRPDRGKARGGPPASAGWEQVERRLPVGGTWITEHALFGPWRVDVYLDREEMPLASEVFVLTP